jgi:predicted Zn finger-like uncharacterized protein
MPKPTYEGHEQQRINAGRLKHFRQNASMPRSWEMSPCEMFDCPHCGAVYAVRYTQLPIRDSDSVYCEICHQKMMQWHATARPSYTLITSDFRRQRPFSYRLIQLGRGYGQHRCLE